MKRIIIGLAGIVLATALGAQGMMGDGFGSPNGGPGYGNGGPGYGWGGFGMMGGFGGARGTPGWGGCGAYGQGEGYPVARDPLSIDEAKAQADKYLASWNDPNLVVSEIMEFSNQFYVAFVEKDSKTGAFEMLMDKYSGAMTPEPGPDMMWNLKYGMMARGVSAGTESSFSMPLSLAKADAAAQTYLDSFGNGYTAENGGDPFYGYYTIHVLKDGKIIGMLGVNGFSGQVWYHNWHGDYVDMKSFD